jgi:hypothetical protein
MICGSFTLIADLSFIGGFFMLGGNFDLKGVFILLYDF